LSVNATFQNNNCATHSGRDNISCKYFQILTIQCIETFNNLIIKRAFVLQPTSTYDDIITREKPDTAINCDVQNYDLLQSMMT